MPAARLFSLKIARRTVLLIAVAFIVSTIPVTTRTASACTTVPPMPLRLLYTVSDLVVVARIGQTTPVKLIVPEEEGADKRYLMKTDLKVSSTVKGEGNHAVLDVYHIAWSGKDDEYQHMFNENYGNEKALIFLVRREEGGYEVLDNAYGVKQLEEAALKVYLQRLEELGVILQQKNPDRAQIVEWLVRCAEEPATRWEGLQEFTMSNYALSMDKRSEEAAAQQAQATDEAESGEVELKVAERGSQRTSVDGEANAQSGDETAIGAAGDFVLSLRINRTSQYVAEPELVKSLTDEQKTRISNILFNTRTITYEETPIIELVKQWKDPRLVPFLMSQLRAFEADPPDVAEALVSEVAEILEDKELLKLAERYCENAIYQTEEDINQSAQEEEEEEATAEEAETQAEGADATAETATSETTEEAAAEEDEDEVPVEGNPTQQRSTRLQRFIARAETLLGRQQTASR